MCAFVAAMTALLHPQRARGWLRASAYVRFSSSYRANLFSLRPERFGAPAGSDDVALLKKSRLVVFGEIHEVPPCIEFQRRTALAMLDASTTGTLHVVLEHFNFDLQPALNEYAEGLMSFQGLVERAESSGEGHAVGEYAPLLELARTTDGRVALHAGFIPRSFARLVMRESLEAALAAAKHAGYVASDETLAASEAHYSFFESLLTGRSLHGEAARPPADTYRKMFPAQVIKDAAMAHKVSMLVSTKPEADRFLVVCGIGHSGYSYGVPERIYAAHPALQPSYRIWSLPVAATLSLDDAPAVLAETFGGAHTNPAELCLAFAQVEQAAMAVKTASEVDTPAASDASAEHTKAATAEAYEKVGKTDHLQGDGTRARAISIRAGAPTQD